jgi:membrane protein YdbS with pleckstrin-like domain
MAFYNTDHSNLLAVGIAVFVCIVMMVTERRLGLIGGLAGIAVAVWAVLDKSGIGWYWFLIPLAFAILALLVNYIYLSRVMFVVTDRRVLTRYGIFTLHYADIGVDKIQNVTVMQPWYERILGFGDIYFATAGEKGGIDYESPGIKLMTGGAVSWENVTKPFEVIKVASAIIHPGATPVMIINQPTQPMTPSGTQDRLRELDELEQKGLISKQEYDEKRKQILDRL